MRLVWNSIPSHKSNHIFTDIFTFYFFNNTATTDIYTLSLHDALPISFRWDGAVRGALSVRSTVASRRFTPRERSEEHTSELQSRGHLVCRLLLEKKKSRNASSTRLSAKSKLSKKDSRLRSLPSLYKYS